MNALAPQPSLLLARACARRLRQRNGRLQGWVEADFVFVGPDEAGRIEALHVREGDTVAAGAPLFAVDADLQSADAALGRRRRSPKRARGSRGSRAPQQRNEEVAVLQAQEKRAEAAVAAFHRRARAPAGVTPQGRRRAGAVRHRAGELQSRQGRARGSAPPDHGRAHGLARGGHRGGRTALAARGRAARRRADPARAAQARRPGRTARCSRSITGPARWCRPARPVVSHPAARQYQAALLRRAGAAAEDRARRRRHGDVRRLPPGITAKVSFIARSAEFTPPVIYSLEERNKLVFMVEARPDEPDGLRVGQPVR